MPLNARQQRFVAEYLTDLNATQAAIRAGYSERTAQEQSSRLLSKAIVREAVTAAQGKISKRLELTAEKILRDLEEMRLQALSCMQFSPAIKACELQGKHLGMFVERSESTVTLNDAIDRPPHETREEWLARREKELGIAPMGSPAGTAD